jgi:O-methyltransferase
VNYRYSPLQRELKKLWRKFSPVPVSPWTAGYVDDICAVNLVPPERLISFFKDCISLLQETKGDNTGDYLEFGVFNGNSIGSMYLAREATGVKSMRLFGFDAFEGLPAGSETEDDGVWKKGFYACSFEQMESCLARRSIPLNEITWVQGWYDQTLNKETTRKFDLGNFGIVFIDCDTYSSSKTVLDFLAPLVSQPFIICLDDWKLNDLDIKEMGEYKSFNEFLESNSHIQAKEIRSYNRKSKTFLITLRESRPRQVSL